MSLKQKPEQPKDPALAVSNFYYFSLTIINEINFARTSLRQYVDKLEKIKSLISKQEDKKTLYVKKYTYKYSNLEYELQKAIEFLKT
jgi:dTDP-glucose pyrophosphorylase